MPEYEYIYGCDIYIQSAEWCSRDFTMYLSTPTCLLRKITPIPITTQQTNTVTIKTSQSAADFPAYKDEPFIYLNKQHSSLSWYSSRKKPQLYVPAVIHPCMLSVVCLCEQPPHCPGVQQGYRGAPGTGSCLSFVNEPDAHHDMPHSDIQLWSCEYFVVS